MRAVWLVVLTAAISAPLGWLWGWRAGSKQLAERAQFDRVFAGVSDAGVRD